MPSTYSNLKIELMATGEKTTTWGDITNVNLGTALEEAIVGSADVTFASGNVTLTLTNTNASQTARNVRLRCTGTTGGARNLVVPSIEKPYIVRNDCADAITVKTAAGTGVAVPAGKTMWLYVDGTNVVDAVTHLSSLTLTTPLPAAQGGTGTTTSTGSGSVVLATSPTLVTPVLGAASATSITNGLGAVGTPSYTFTGDTNTGFWSPSADALAVSTGGTERLRVTPAGDIGVGIVAPGVKFDVAGAIRSFVGGQGIRIAHDGTNGTLASSTALLVYADGANDIIFHTNATRRMRVTGAGNVGIGTDSPSERLSVVGNITATGALTLGTALAVAQGGTGATDAGTARTNLSAAARSQTDQISGFISSPANKLYRVAIKMAFAGTITETTTRSASGTCTATFSINGSNLGGTANSVSSSEQSQAHASANTFAAGDDIELTVSANSSCADMSFTIAYTRTLA